jgi:hypothetical protein
MAKVRPTDSNKTFEKEEYDEWVVQRKPIPDSEKYYDDYDWTTITKGLSYKEAKEESERRNGGVNKGHYLFRLYPQEES